MAEHPRHQSRFTKNKNDFKQDHLPVKTKALTFDQSHEDNLPTREKSFQRQPLCDISLSLNQPIQAHLSNWGTCEPGCVWEENVQTTCITDQVRNAEHEMCSSVENMSNNNIQDQIPTAVVPHLHGVGMMTSCNPTEIMTDDQNRITCCEDTSDRNECDCSDQGSDCSDLNVRTQQVCCIDDFLVRTIGLQTEPFCHAHTCEIPCTPADHTGSSVSSSTDSNCQTYQSDSSSTSHSSHCDSPYSVPLREQPKCVPEIQSPTPAPCPAPGNHALNIPPIYILNQMPCTNPVFNPMQTCGMCTGQFSPICSIPITTAEQPSTIFIRQSSPERHFPNCGNIAMKPCSKIPFGCDRVCLEEPKQVHRVCFDITPSSNSKYFCHQSSCHYNTPFRIPGDQEIVPYDCNGQYNPKVEEEGTTGFISEKTDCPESDSEDEEEETPKKIGESSKAVKCFKHPCFPKGFIYCEPNNEAKGLKKSGKISSEKKEKPPKDKKPKPTISWEDEKVETSSKPVQGELKKEKDPMPNTFSLGKIFPTQSTPFETHPCFLERVPYPRTPCSSPVPNAAQRIEFSENLLRNDSDEVLTESEAIPSFLKLPTEDIRFLDKIHVDTKNESEFPWKCSIHRDSTEIIAYPCTHSATYKPPPEPCRSKPSSSLRRSSPTAKKVRNGSTDQVIEKRYNGTISVQLLPPPCSKTSPSDTLSDYCQCVRENRARDCVNRSPSQGYATDCFEVPSVCKIPSQPQIFQTNESQSFPCSCTDSSTEIPCDDGNPAGGMNNGMQPFQSQLRQINAYDGMSGRMQQCIPQKPQTNNGMNSRMQQQCIPQLPQVNDFNGMSKRMQQCTPEMTQIQIYNSQRMYNGMEQCQPQMHQGQLEQSRQLVQAQLEHVRQLEQAQRQQAISAYARDQNNENSPFGGGSPIEHKKSKSIRTLYPDPQQSKTKVGVSHNQRCQPLVPSKKSKKKKFKHAVQLDNEPPITQQMLCNSLQGVQNCTTVSSQDAKMGNFSQMGNFPPQAAQIGNFVPQSAQVGNLALQASQGGNFPPKGSQSCNSLPANAQRFNLTPSTLQTGNFRPQASQMSNLMPQATQMGSYMPKSTQLRHVPSSRDQNRKFQSPAGMANFSGNNKVLCGPNNDICCCCQRPFPLGYKNSQPMQLSQSSSGYPRDNLQCSSAQTEIQQDAKGVQVGGNRSASTKIMESSISRLSRPYSSKRKFDGCRKSPENCPVMFLPVCYNSLGMQELNSCDEQRTSNNCYSPDIQTCLVVKPCKLPQRKLPAVCSPDSGAQSGTVAYGQIPQTSQFYAPTMQPNMSSFQPSTLRSCSSGLKTAKSRTNNSMSKPFLLTFPINKSQEEGRKIGFIQNLPQGCASRSKFNTNYLAS